MIDHISTYTTDYAASKAFYAACLSTLGASQQAEFVAEWNPEFPTQRICAFGLDGQPSLWIIETKAAFTPRHIAFAASSRDAVNNFYAQALAAGGSDNGEPGPRPMYSEHYYGAFTFDPDGNNVEAVCRVQLL